MTSLPEFEITALYSTARNLCLLSLSWDGVAVIDVADGPNQQLGLQCKQSVRDDVCDDTCS